MGFLIKLEGKDAKDLEFVFEIALENIIEGKLIAFPMPLLAPVIIAVVFIK